MGFGFVQLIVIFMLFGYILTRRSCLYVNLDAFARLTSIWLSLLKSECCSENNIFFPQIH